MNKRIIGYLRVSKVNQNLELQRRAIEDFAEKNGISNVVFYEEKISSRKKRQELEAALKAATNGDIFACYKIDRVARSVRELENFIDDLEKREVKFVSTSDNIDLSTPAGKMMFQMLAVFAEFERNIISERTRDGLEAAAKLGKKGGRPRVGSDLRKKIFKLYESGESATSLAKTFKISRGSIYNIINEMKED